MISNREEIKIALKENQEVAIQRIDDTLKEWGWTRKVLAERAGIKENTLYNIFGGSNKLGISVFQSIAQALGVSEHYLLGSTNNPHEGFEHDPIFNRRIPKTGETKGEDVAHGTKSAAEQKIQSIIAKLSTEDLEEAANLLERLYRDRTSPTGGRSPKPRNQ